MIKYELIKKFSLEFPNKIALKEGNQIITWRDFERNVLSILENIITKENFNKDNPVLYLSENSSHLVLLMSAFSTLGMPFQGMDHHLSVEIISQLIKTLKVKYIFLSKELSKRFSILSDYCKIYEIESFINHSLSLKNTAYSNDISPLPFASISFTSGTTGIPKIVYRTTSFDKKRFEFLEKTYGFNQGDVHLLCLPMHHVGTTGWARLFLGLGCTVVIAHFKTSYDLCEIIHHEKISTTIMSPSMLKGIVDALDLNQVRNYFSNLRFIITGGKNCFKYTKEKAISTFGDIIYEYYGTTETGINTLLSSADFKKYPGSVGRVFEGNEIVVVDEKNEPVNAGKIGRIAIHSYMNMNKYLNYSSPFIMIREKEYFLTADYGFFNKEGFLYVLQRSVRKIDQVFNFYGLESAIMDLQYVSDVFVSGSENKKVFIHLVPKKYVPSRKIQEDVFKISNQYGLHDVVVNIVPQLAYTATGKIKL